MFPIIPLLCLSGMLGGGSALAWYLSLNPRRREEMDAVACQYAWQVFEKSLDQLTADEARHVYHLTRQHFG